jgi:hypothetical protein
MPRLAETIFIPMLAILGTAGPKLIQYIAGLVSAFLTFKITRNFYPRLTAMLATVLFYSTWLVGWQSGSAYIDLIRTLFELAGLYYLVIPPKKVWLSGIFFGLAVGVKWQSLISVLLAGLIFQPSIVPIALLTASPWFFLAYHYTGNAVYPFFEPWLKHVQLLEVGQNYWSISQIVKRIILIPYYLVKPFDDQLNPLLGFLVLPTLWLQRKQSNTNLRKLTLYLIGGLISWQILAPPSSRYFLPYLPILAILTAALVIKYKKWLLPITILSFLAILGLRAWANSKYLPIILRQETQNEFLTKQANKLPGTFIDSDNWVEKNIPKEEILLVDGLHNVYYLPVDFDHTSWMNQNYDYQYLITPNRPGTGWQLIHINSLGIKVYKKAPHL